MGSSGKFPKFPYRGGKYLKVGNYCGNLSLPSGNLLDSDLVTLPTITTAEEANIAHESRGQAARSPQAQGYHLPHLYVLRDNDDLGSDSTHRSLAA